MNRKRDIYVWLWTTCVMFDITNGGNFYLNQMNNGGQYGL